MFWRRRSQARGDTARAALEAQVAALEAALAKSRSDIGRWTRRQLALLAVVAAMTLAAGVAVGSNLGPIRQGFANLAQSLGFMPTVPSADAAYAALEKGRDAVALRLARPLAEDGNVLAQYVLGYIYYHGRGVAKSDPEAIKWFRLSAERGDAGAQYHLGIMYGEGQSVPEDHAESAKWYQRAADQGHAQAQYNLGLAFAKGEGVEQDHRRAHMWFNIAAARFAAADTRNRGAAARNRDVIAGKMSREELAEAQRLAREWQPR